MGFLGIFGRVLSFDESKEYFSILRENAVQLIVNAIKSETICEPQFGYEFEFHKIFIDNENQRVQVDLTGQDDVINSSTYNLNTPFHLSHEYGGWMIEVCHENPFHFNNIDAVIESVDHCYNYLKEKIGPHTILSLPSFPMLGVGEDYYKKDSYWETKEEENKEGFNELLDDNTKEKKDNTSCTCTSSKNTVCNSEREEEEIDITTNPFSKSQFIHDCIINRHPRFGNLSRNIRLRRGKKVEIKIPIYKDINTIKEPTKDEPYPGYVYMDAMAFGMGNCCSQITLGCCCVNSATYLYDQMLPLTPILLALSSACPVYKGKLTDFDNRFSLICQGVDDRTDEEKDPNSNRYIHKSRYSPAYTYISESKYSDDFNNDTPKFPINQEYYETFVKNGIPPKLSLHFANILVRDPLVVFSDKINITDPKDMTHFENFNSTNWNSLRFKLPRPSDHDTCFKIEVRPCDLQITPYENTAIFALILGLYEVIMRYDVNFIIPISKVDENFERAYTNDQINKKKFWWRINGLKEVKIQPLGIGKYNPVKPNERTLTKEEDEKNIVELTIDEIINGSEKYHYPGLMPYLIDAMKNLYKTDKLNEYLDFISKRASGKYWTGAKYIRNFILNHPLYKHDSIINDKINYDLICHLLKIQNGEIKPEEMFGKEK